MGLWENPIYDKVIWAIIIPYPKVPEVYNPHKSELTAYTEQMFMTHNIEHRTEPAIY